VPHNTLLSSQLIPFQKPSHCSRSDYALRLFIQEPNPCVWQTLFGTKTILYLPLPKSRTQSRELSPAHTILSVPFDLRRFRINRLRSSGPDIQNHQHPTIATVRGTAIATYSDNSAPSNIGMLKTEARNVLGRNTMVRAAMVFIAAPSALASSAIAVLVVASCCVTRLKTCETLARDPRNSRNPTKDLQDSTSRLCETCNLQAIASETLPTPKDSGSNLKSWLQHSEDRRREDTHNTDRAKLASGAGSSQSCRLLLSRARSSVKCSAAGQSSARGLFYAADVIAC
jgi:hypothetical protein